MRFYLKDGNGLKGFQEEMWDVEPFQFIINGMDEEAEYQWDIGIGELEEDVVKDLRDVEIDLMEYVFTVELVGDRQAKIEEGSVWVHYEDDRSDGYEGREIFKKVLRDARLALNEHGFEIIEE